LNCVSFYYVFCRSKYELECQDDSEQLTGKDDDGMIVVQVKVFIRENAWKNHGKSEMIICLNSDIHNKTPSQ